MLNNKNLTAPKWCELLNIEITDWRRGWNNDEEFQNLFLTKSEFLNRASVSQIKKPEIKSRREASLFLNNLNNKSKPAQ